MKNKKLSIFFRFTRSLCTSCLGVLLLLSRLSAFVHAQTKEQLPEDMPFPSYPPSIRQQQSFQELWKQALQHNPTLQRIRSQFAIAAAKIKQAGAWPDLQIGLQASNFPMPTFRPNMMTGIQYTIAQKFPILGRLEAQRSIAKAELQKLKLLLQEEQAKIAYAIRQQLLALWDIRLQWDLRRELYQLTQQVTAVVRTRYATSTARKQDLFLALLQLAQLRQEALQLKLRAQRKQFLLQRLTQPAPSLQNKEGTRPNVQPLPKAKMPNTNIQEIRSSLSIFILTKKSLQAMLQYARTHRPILHYWWVDAKQAQQLKQLAASRYWPDITLRLDVRQRFPNAMDQGEPFLSLGVQIPLPTWGNTARQGLSEEASARYMTAQKRLHEMLAELRQQVRDTLQTLRNLQQQQELYTQQLLPLAQQTYQASLASYQVGKEDFSNLLGHIKRYITLRLQAKRLHLASFEQEARLLALQGVPFQEKIHTEKNLNIK